MGGDRFEAHPSLTGSVGEFIQCGNGVHIVRSPLQGRLDRRAPPPTAPA